MCGNNLPASCQLRDPETVEAARAKRLFVSLAFVFAHGWNPLIGVPAVEILHEKPDEFRKFFPFGLAP